MWIRKGLRDVKKGVDSPMPTQAVSNEEFAPRPQTPQQKQVENLIGEMADQRSKKLGMDRRSFMASTMGLATCFLPLTKSMATSGKSTKRRRGSPPLTKRSGPRVSTSLSTCRPISPMASRSISARMDFVKNMGFNLKNDAESYSFRNFVKEMYFDSETSMVVISGVPGLEINKDASGKVLEGKARTPQGERFCQAG